MENLISVIIPSYNRKNFISQAIDSVLKQTYKNIEIIVVDDGSNDGTEESIREKYGESQLVNFYRNEKNSGAGFSRKFGYQKSKGEYLVFMDDDDYYTNYKFFEEAIKILKKLEDISFISSSSIIEYVNENQKEESIMNIKGEIKNSEYISSFQQKYMKSNSTFTTIFKKKKLEEANFKDVEMVNDSSIYLRALLSGNAYIMDDCISGIYRVHSRNISFNLGVDFIIENLIEKKKIYEEIKIRKLLQDPEEWLKNQILLTTSYFVKNNKIKEEDFKKLTDWCRQNEGDKVSNILIELRGEC